MCPDEVVYPNIHTVQFSAAPNSSELATCYIHKTFKSSSPSACSSQHKFFGGRGEGPESRKGGETLDFHARKF